MPVNSNKPTMQMIADKVGVSIASVSHVFNRSRFVQEDLRKKILDCAEEIGYTKKHSLVRSKVPDGASIALIINDIRDSVLYQDVIKTTESIAAEQGYTLLIGDSENSVEKEISLIENFIERQVSGLLLASSQPNGKHLENIPCSQELPLVLIDRNWTEKKFDYVGIDNFQTSFHVTQLLQQQGLENIGFLGFRNLANPDIQPSTLTERENGYKVAMLSAQLSEYYDTCLVDPLGDISQQVIQFCCGKTTSGKKTKAQKQAILCFNAPVCRELLSVLQKASISPAEFSISTYDEESWFQFLPVPLLAIRQPVAEISMTAVQLLLEKIHNLEKINTGQAPTTQVFPNSGRQILHPVEFCEIPPWQV